MSADHGKRLARIDSQNEFALRHPRVPQRHGLTLLEVQSDGAQALTRLNDNAVRLAGVALPLLDPRIIAGRLEAAAARARIAVLTEAETAHMYADEVNALAAALRLSLARSEAESPFTGDAA